MIVSTADSSASRRRTDKSAMGYNQSAPTIVFGAEIREEANRAIVSVTLHLSAWEDASIVKYKKSAIARVQPLTHICLH